MTRVISTRAWRVIRTRSGDARLSVRLSYAPMIDDRLLDAALSAALATLKREPDVRYAEVRFVDEQSERLRVRDGRPEQVTSGAPAAWASACSASVLGLRVHRRPQRGRARRAPPRSARCRIARASSRGRARRPSLFPEQPPRRGRYETPLAVDPFTVPSSDKLAALDAPVRALLAPAKRACSPPRRGWSGRARASACSPTEGTDTRSPSPTARAGCTSSPSTTTATSQRRSYPTWQGGDGFQAGYERIARARPRGPRRPRDRDEARGAPPRPPAPRASRDVLLESSQVAPPDPRVVRPSRPSSIARSAARFSLAGGSFLQPACSARSATARRS